MQCNNTCCIFFSFSAVTLLIWQQKGIELWKDRWFVGRSFMTGAVYVLQLQLPRVGSGVVRIDPLRFLASCRTRRLNQV